jgi:hypothetical protein
MKSRNKSKQMKSRNIRKNKRITRGIQVPPGYVLRSSASSDGRGEVLDFQPKADAARHTRERHQRDDQHWMMPWENSHKKNKTRRFRR